jgi:mannose-6-phosphate isomerase-like protein (cupin superfamily)
MLRVTEADVEGVRAAAPHARTLKHMVAPWLGGSDSLWVGFSLVDEGSSSNPHHHDNEEIFIVVDGTGQVVVDDERAPLTRGTVVRIPPGAVHQLVNCGAGVLKVACVASPAFSARDFDTAHRLDSAAPDA